MPKFDPYKTVALVAGHDRRETVRTALGILGEPLIQKIKAAKKIFVHPNLVTTHKKEATTDVEAVRGVVDHIALYRGDEILLGDAPFRGSVEDALTGFDYQSLSRSGNVKFIDLNRDETIESWAYTADFKKRPIPFSKTVAESDFNIVVVPAKMHSYTIVSLSIKTQVVGSQVVKKSPFGIHPRWPWNHTGYKQIHHTFAEVYAEHPAGLAVIDGTQAMEGNGPTSGTVVNLGWVIASFNPVAADALAAYLMGFDPEDIGYLYHLGKMGLGPVELSEMSIVGGGNPEALRRDIKKPDSYPGIMEWR